MELTSQKARTNSELTNPWRADYLSRAHEAMSNGCDCAVLLPEVEPGRFAVIRRADWGVDVSLRAVGGAEVASYRLFKDDGRVETRDSSMEVSNRLQHVEDAAAGCIRAGKGWNVC